MAISRSQMDRQLRNMSGIMSLENPRQGYFLGKLVRKAKKAVKKVVKSPIGKAALAAAAIKFGGPLAAKFAPGTFGSAAKSPFLRALGRGQFLGDTGILSAGKTALFGSQGVQGTSGLLGKLGLTKGGGSLGLTGLGKLATIGGVSGLAGLLAAQEAEDEEGIDISDIDRGEGLNILDIVARARKNDPEFRFLPGAEFTTAFAEGGGVGSLAMNEEGVDQKFVSDEAGALPKKGGGVTPSDMGKLKKSDFDSEEDYQRYLRQLNRKAEGGTIKDFEKFMKERMEMEKMMNQKRLIEDFKQYMNRGKPVEAKEGGLMDLGGMEMDLRGGGFVPLGAKEKADDVPARLSKNEFVMTADAVRAAGGGSIDKGADKMYNLMKDLEAKV
jgi:hypothetical protein